jgi:hypothetical protein
MKTLDADCMRCETACMPGCVNFRCPHRFMLLETNGNSLWIDGVSAGAEPEVKCHPQSTSAPHIHTIYLIDTEILHSPMESQAAIQEAKAACCSSTVRAP